MLQHPCDLSCSSPEPDEAPQASPNPQQRLQHHHAASLTAPAPLRSLFDGSSNLSTVPATLLCLRRSPTMIVSPAPLCYTSVWPLFPIFCLHQPPTTLPCAYWPPATLLHHHIISMASTILPLLLLKCSAAANDSGLLIWGRCCLFYAWMTRLQPVLLTTGLDTSVYAIWIISLLLLVLCYCFWCLVICSASDLCSLQLLLLLLHYLHYYTSVSQLIAFLTGGDVKCYKYFVFTCSILAIGNTATVSSAISSGPSGAPLSQDKYDKLRQLEFSQIGYSSTYTSFQV